MKFCGGRSHAEVTEVYLAAKAAYREAHPAPNFGDDDELRRLYTLDSINAGDNAVNRLCNDATRYPTEQHVRYLREQGIAA